MNVKNVFFFFPLTLAITTLSFHAPAHRHAPPMKLAQQGPPPLDFGPGGPGGMQGLPPGVTQEQFEAALQEVDNFFKNMSEEEMNEFVNFVQDVESGKINIDELLPPGMVPPPTPGAPQKPAAPTPAAKPVEALVEKPKPAAPALRNKKTAQEMVKNIIERLASLHAKAEGYELVADKLKPWRKQLDTLVYYLTVVSDKNHIEQLISDRDLLPLHDALKELSDSLSFQEPLLKVPAFGIEKQDPATKERSKKALNTILNNFDTAFNRKMVIPGLESLMKKYEPELLRKRKEAEAAQERALHEAEARKGRQPAPSKIRTGDYGRGGGRGFYDQYYSPRTSGSTARPYQPAHGGPVADRSVPGRRAPEEEKKGEKKTEEKKVAEGEKGKKEEKPAELKKKEEKKVEPLPEPAPYTPGTDYEKTAMKWIGKIGKSFDIIEDKFSYEPMLEDTETYFAAQAPADDKKAQAEELQQASALNEALDEISRALHRVIRDKSSAETSIRKSPGHAQRPLREQLNYALYKGAEPLEELYKQGLALLKKTIGSQEQPVNPAGLALNQKVALHLGVALGAVPPAHLRARGNSLGQFLESYELLYLPDEKRPATKIMADRAAAERAAEEAGLNVQGEIATE